MLEVEFRYLKSYHVRAIVRPYISMTNYLVNQESFVLMQRALIRYAKERKSQAHIGAASTYDHEITRLRKKIITNRTQVDNLYGKAQKSLDKALAKSKIEWEATFKEIMDICNLILVNIECAKIGHRSCIKSPLFACIYPRRKESSLKGNIECFFCGGVKEGKATALTTWYKSVKKAGVWPEEFFDSFRSKR